MAGIEKILVLRRDVFDELGAFHGVKFDVERYMARFWSEGVLSYMPRPEAEKDPRFKQLIPYVILSCQGKYLCYVRGKRAGETRLVSKTSIGIGGHINPIDDRALFGGGFRDAYLAAVQREVDEEISVNTGHIDRIVGLLNDDSNEVGQVHLGVVHHWRLDQPAVEKREQMITHLSFLSVDELRAIRDHMETWSQLCLDHIEQIAR